LVWHVANILQINWFDLDAPKFCARELRNEESDQFKAN
jgi:hypothetical protein